MSTPTIQDVRRADQLWDKMPLHRVAEETDLSYYTLKTWAQKGWIESAVDWRAEKEHPYAHPEETVTRADRLWDVMPLQDVAGVLDVPYSTLKKWSAKGRIDTDVDWSAKQRERAAAKRRSRAVQLVIRQGKTQREAARIMDLSESTISKYITTFKSSSKS